MMMMLRLTIDNKPQSVGPFDNQSTPHTITVLAMLCRGRDVGIVAACGMLLVVVVAFGSDDPYFDDVVVRHYVVDLMVCIWRCG